VNQRFPLQANRPKLPIIPAENRIIIPRLPKVPNVLPVSHVHISCHAGCGGPGCTHLPCIFKCVCERYTHVLPKRRASAVSGRHGFRIQDPQFIASRRLPGGHFCKLDLWLRELITLRRGPLWSFSRPGGASKNSDQCSLYEGQKNGSKQLVIFG
jgi:hypothetical protein